MDDPQETEFLLQVAAGTDPLTALVAVRVVTRKSLNDPIQLAGW